MKKLLYILLSTPLLALWALYSPTPCKAQTPGHKVDSVYVYNEKDSLIFMQEWFYDGNNVTNEVQYTWNKDGAKHGDFNTFKAFDAKGNNVLYVTLDWDDVKQDWKGRGRFENVYNEGSKFSYHALWKEDQWKKDSIWLCQYNAQKQPILTLHQLFRNGEWQDQYKLTQGYDGSREIYHEEYSGRDVNGLIGIKKWIQLYNGSTKISDRQYSWSGTEFVPKSWDTVGIVGGRTTLKESYVWTNGVQTGTSKEEWEFNGSGRQTLHITYSGWENGAFVPATKQEDEWNGSTNTISAKYNWDKTNKKWVGTSKTENLTSDGYTIKKTYKGWANNDFVPETIDSTKNENGKKVYYAKWTYTNGVWTGTSKEIYAFDGSKNQLSQEKYSSWSNGSWIGSNGNKWEQIWKNNKVWSKVTYNWSSGWVPNIKDSTEYNGSDITFSVHYKYVNGAWEGDNSKSNYSQTYISAGQKEWTTTLKWENNQWTNYIQTKSTYSGGKLVEERSQQWNNTTSAWQDVKVVYHRWENGVEVFTRTEEWDTETQGLKMTSEYKHIITKDEKGHTILDKEEKCGADSVWVGDTKYKYETWEYADNSGNFTEHVVYEWKSNKWTEKTKQVIVRTENNLTLTNSSYVWKNGEWEYKEITEYEYDEQYRVLVQSYKKYNNGLWVGVYKYEYQYDMYGNTIMNATYGGDVVHVWVGTSKYEYEYDEKKNLLSSTTYEWNSSTNDWQILFKDENEYDEKSRTVVHTRYTRSYVTGELVFKSKEQYFYLGNDTNPSSTLIYEYVIPTGEETERWVVKQEDTYKYDDNDSSKKLREEIHGTWSKGVVIKYERKVYFYNDDPK